MAEAETKTRLFALIFGWPFAVLLGWVVAGLTHNHWPMAVFPAAWLGVLFWKLSVESEKR